jgi:hypothetical protein
MSLEMLQRAVVLFELLNEISECGRDISSSDSSDFHESSVIYTAGWTDAFEFI